MADIEDAELDEPRAAELLLAVTYPGVLRISDVTFANPRQEIPEAKRQYRFQTHRGLGLFSEFLDRCEQYCREAGISEITLAAAYIDLVPFFQRFGFHVEDTPTGRMYLELKQGIPMVRAVRAAA